MSNAPAVRRRLSRSDWASAALAAIGEGGVAAVAVEPLAARLGTTKGSFYWHFPSRDALVAAALDHWERTTTDEVIAEIDAVSDDPAARLRALFKRVTELAASDRIEVALLATADHPLVAPVLERVTRRRMDYCARLFAQLGLAPAESRRRALLAYSAYLGHAQLAHSTPDLLPRGRSAKRSYLDHVLEALGAAPPAGLTRGKRTPS
jgi:AcrR family transcriptional regulator